MMNQSQTAIQIDTTMKSEEQHRADYLLAAGLLGQDKKEMRKAALEVAHEIRQFEISLYWSRSSYFWGFQIAFFAAIGLVVSELPKAMSASEPSARTLALLVGFLVSLLATIFCWLWIKMIDGAKTWQDVWERHIDMLEDEFTGSIYKTYLFDREAVQPGSGPYSVSKINKLIVKTLLTFWIFSTILILCALTSNLDLFQKLDLSSTELYGIVVLACIAVLFFFLGLSNLLITRMTYHGEELKWTSNADSSHSLYKRKLLKRAQ